LKDLLLVDGYNIIHFWPELKALLEDVGYEAARSRLIDIICDFSAHSNYETVVVFDAHMIKGGMRHEESYPPIKVIFTAENETADRYIEGVVHRQDKRLRDVYVATSDAAEQTVIFGSGGARLSARELLRMVNESKGSQKKTIYKLENESRNTIANSLGKKTLERLEQIVKNIRMED
jgi:predicted RNA-binding protein with PIN domain